MQHVPFGSAVRTIGAAVIAMAATAAVHAAAVMPSFASLPTGWTTDRYEPASFGNVGTFAGRNDVLGIGIDTSTDLANRPAAFQSTFYNTQGRQHALNGVAGDDLSADLYVETSWRSGTAGYVRSDLWAVLSDVGGVTDYGIIGFTNYGGAARLRVWDADTVNGWVDLGTAPAFGAWNAFQVLFTGSSLDYFVGGNLVYSDTTIGGDRISAVIMQAYNFADPSLNGTTVPYVAHWSAASAVPEPASLALVALALAGLAGARRRRRDVPARSGE